MANVHATNPAPDLAEWVREKQVFNQFGLGRSPLKRLRETGKLRFISLREPGMKQGTLLYNIESIRAYLATKEKEAKASAGKEGA